MRKKTIYFLLIGFVILIVTTISSMTYLVKTMADKSMNTINDIGDLYMAGLNERIGMHFQATMDSRLSRLEYITESVPPGKYDDHEEMGAALSYAADARGLVYLAYLSEEGELETIFGDYIELLNQDAFLESMCSDVKRIVIGKDANGDMIAVMGVRAEYDMENGEKSVALVAGVPVSYLKQLLALDNDYSVVYSHIIRNDGSFIIKSNESVEEDNCFDLLSVYAEEGDNHSSVKSVQELKEAMAAQEDYTAVFYLENDERQHIYCSALPYSDWYLITIMPYGELDQSINDLNQDRIGLTILCLGIIIAVLLCIFAIFFHMTRRQLHELEKAREKAIEASKAKSDFLSNMSHDIRTPMNAIAGMTSIAIANIGNNRKVEDCLKKITQSSKHLLGLINDILDMSKIESGKMTLNMESVSIKEEIDEVVNIIQPHVKEKHQKFEVCLQDLNVEHVYCDSVRLNQVLLNFLSNAVKFTQDGGSISLTVREEDSPLGASHVRIHLYVKDTGIGMTPEFQKVIFQSFVREDSKRVQKTEGTGLGMAIAKYIIDAMGGVIEVDSEKGRGTEFHVVLDLEIVQGFVSESGTLPEKEEDSIPDFGGVKILLAEDNDLNWEIANELLSQMGLCLEHAENGRICVEMFEKSPEGYYAAVLMDIRMPEMTGYEACRAIRKLDRADSGIPIIAMTADTFTEDIQRCLACGMNAHVAKPIDIREVARLLKSFL